MTKTPKLDEPTAIKLLIPARVTRESVEEFSPMVLYAPRRGQAFMAVLEGDGRLHEMLTEVLSQMRAQLGPATWIAVTTDNYAKPTATPMEANTVEHGQLAEEFAAGDPKVIEQIMVILKHRAKPVEVAVQTYRHIPSEGWEWDEPERIDGTEGAVMDVLSYYI